MRKLLLVVPCYNEEVILRDSVERLSALLAAMKADGLIAGESGIMLVDDGSADGTWSIIRELHGKNPGEISALRLAANRGHQSALLAGLMESRKRADITVSLDADLQDDIQVIPEMVRKAETEGADIVFGVRSDRSTDSWCKRFFAESFYRLMRFMGVRTVMNHADFRLMSARALDALSEYNEVNLFLRGLVASLGFDTATVYYKRAAAARATHYSIAKMVHLAWDGITSFSVYPIMMLSAAGVIFMLLGLGIMGYILFSKFFGYTVRGWTFLASLIVIFGGFQTFAIGIIGEYIAKTYLEAKHRPVYYIRERLENPAPERQP